MNIEEIRASRTRRKRTHQRPFDPNEKRYFVYRLHDELGQVLYVGRSCNVANRIRAHYSDAQRQFSEDSARKALWFSDVRSVSMFGPFTWDEAVAAERREIETCQPTGNRMFTKRDHVPSRRQYAEKILAGRGA